MSVTESIVEKSGKHPPVATKLVCINYPTGTSTGDQAGANHLAACAELQIDEVLIQ